jgi:hypothetical protein
MINATTTTTSTTDLTTPKGGYRLFIDDERFPVDDAYVIVRSSKDAIDIVRDRGMPTDISFDHDLGYADGGDDTTMVFLNWLTEELIKGRQAFPRGFIYSVHSQNNVGVKNIHGLMQNLLKHFPPVNL